MHGRLVILVAEWFGGAGRGGSEKCRNPHLRPKTGTRGIIRSLAVLSNLVVLPSLFGDFLERLFKEGCWRNDFLLRLNDGIKNLPPPLPPSLLGGRERGKVSYFLACPSVGTREKRKGRRGGLVWSFRAKGKGEGEAGTERVHALWCVSLSLLLLFSISGPHEPHSLAGTVKTFTNEMKDM